MAVNVLRVKYPVASIMSKYSQHPELTTKNDTSMRQNTESLFDKKFLDYSGIHRPKL